MFRNVWSRKTDTPGVFRRTTTLVSQLSISDVLTWCIENDLSPDEVYLTGGGHITWSSPETPEEAAAREAAAVKAQARQDEWERETYERLKVKFRK